MIHQPKARRSPICAKLYIAAAKTAWIYHQSKVDCRSREERLIRGGCPNRGEVLTDNLAARINDAAGKLERAGNAIGNDDFRSSMWLRTKDFQQRGLRGHNWSGRFRHGGFTGVGFHRGEQRAPISV